MRGLSKILVDTGLLQFTLLIVDRFIEGAVRNHPRIKVYSSGNCNLFGFKTAPIEEVHNGSFN